MNDDDDTKKDASLSVSETNALRKRLGLAPLKEEETLTTRPDEKEKRAAQKKEEEDKDKEERLVALREKLKERKRRKMDRLNAKRLYEGEEGEEEDAKTWVQKSRRLNKKTTTTTRSSKGGRRNNSTRDMARRYEEEDEEHGVVEYTEKDLAGLKVDRAALEVVAKGEDGGDGDGVVLTLADNCLLYTSPSPRD